MEDLSHGYQVVNVDTVPPASELCPFVQADLTDFGQALEVLSEVDDRLAGVDALVHLAAIPAPGKQPNAVIFKVNTLSTYNVFEAARRLSIRNIVWASSETVLGLPFDSPPPYAPLDEEYAGRPETAYSLSKLMGEEMARQFCRWDPELKIIGLRFSNVMEPHDYPRFPPSMPMRGPGNGTSGAISTRATPPRRSARRWKRAHGRRDLHHRQCRHGDVQVQCRADGRGFPGVPLKAGFGGNETLLSIEKARRLLGYEPRHAWRGA